MNDRILPTVREGIRNQNRVQRLLARRAAEQKFEKENGHRMAQEDLRTQRIQMLQVPKELPHAARASMRGSHHSQGQESAFTVRPIQRKDGLRFTLEPVLPHFTTRRVTGTKAKMRLPRVSVLAVAFWVVLATSAFPVVAAAPQPDVHKIMSEQLAVLQQQWKDNEKAYAQEQARIHTLAENARKALCSVGDMSKCKHALHSLARAIALRETQNCTTGVGASKNNCFGIKQGDIFVTYDKPEDSYADFMEMWPRVYGWRLPTWDDAVQYTDNPYPKEWLDDVLNFYSKLPHD